VNKNLVLKNLRVALVYDKAVTWGGAERLLLNLHEIFPDAPLYTLVKKDNIEWINKFNNIYASWAQRIPVIRNYHQLLAPWAGDLFSGFDLSKYDLVISITSYDAKSVVTSPNTLHICYCLTPNRFLWVNPGYDAYRGYGLLTPLINIFKNYWLTHLRTSDQYHATFPDKYYTLSELVKKRIWKYYKQDSLVIYPGVDTKVFITKANSNFFDRKYFLVVSRLTGYKHISQLIKIFNNLSYTLLIVGEGSDKEKLQSEIEGQNIKLLGKVSEKKLIALYQNAFALIMLQEEDFGLVVLESMACGTPVIVNVKSGVTELVDNGIHGVVLDVINEKTTMLAIDRIIDTKWNKEKIRARALLYDWKNFRSAIKLEIENEWKRFNQD